MDPEAKTACAGPLPSLPPAGGAVPEAADAIAILLWSASPWSPTSPMSMEREKKYWSSSLVWRAGGEVATASAAV
eukprot:CAMPEP_0185823706 /NCGR_PEP_ID=MMETSP1322-20130828/28583_1 /TAXON_ID=265543 /ORGANISM="Minutocellus polymorphus, Strain RCC2270" /LENGTH=74 /DNA_ID=CAMNT_0028521267 /DNA_START=34 /DNA_END=255 /DNA_ORIENTATION=+